jgi:hypothetical protein
MSETLQSRHERWVRISTNKMVGTLALCPPYVVGLKSEI